MSFSFESENNNIPSFEQMMKPVLAALVELGGEAKRKDLDNKAIELMGLPKEATAKLHTDSKNETEVCYRLAWARTYLKKYGLINNKQRGIWSLTDEFDGDVDNINISDIVNTFSDKSSEEAANNKLSAIESAQLFEKLTLSVINDKTQGQKIVINDNHNQNYDILLPDGIENINGPVYCILKYIGSAQSNWTECIEDIIYRISGISQIENLLLIFNEIVSEHIKKKIKEKILDVKIKNIIIWDKEDLENVIDPDSDTIKYIINPKQALIEDVITSNITDEQRKERNNEFIEGLRRAYKNEDIVLFLGAGVSADSGVPLWSDLIKQMLIHMIDKKVQNKKLTETEQDTLNKLAFQNKEESPLTQMRYIRSAFNNKDYYQIVHSVLYKKDLSINTDILNAIAQISVPHRTYNGIKAIISDNFDDLVERRFKEENIEFNTIFKETNKVFQDKLNIYHVHGYLPYNMDDLDDKPDLIFSEEDYHRIYSDVYSWTNLIQLNAFRENTCLFIGSSLTDPNLRRLLDVASSNKNEPKHYALLRKNVLNLEDKDKHYEDIVSLYHDIDENIRDDYYKQLGLNIIWFEEYSDIPGILLRILD